MTDADRLRTRLAELHLSQRAAARILGINERTMRDYASGAVVPIPDWVWRALASSVASPPAGSSPDDDRDEACVAALEPHLAQIVERARAVGWNEAEIAAALLALIVEWMRERGGDAVARETLASAIMQLDD